MSTEKPIPLRAHPVAYRANLIRYAQDKLDQEDWHGLSDAANDLRELDAAERARREQR